MCDYDPIILIIKWFIRHPVLGGGGGGGGYLAVNPLMEGGGGGGGGVNTEIQ